MEKQIRTRVVPLFALLAAALLSVSARPPKKDAANDNLVRLMKAESIEQLEKNGQQYRKALKSTFLHNGTYLISDSALWNVDTKVINCVGHVKVIQDETILTSDKLDYYIDNDLAQFQGTLVQLQNKKRNILRTRNLDYNTRDSIAFFRGGGAMRDEDGQLIESTSGTYNSAKKFFTFQDEVNMFTDSVFMRTTILHYYSERERAEFPVHVDFWRGGNMLSADEGWYDRGRETFFFTKLVHGLTEEQEFWTDSLYYYRIPSDLLMLGKAQVQDTSRSVAAMADIIYYQDSIRQVTLRKNAAVALFTTEEEKRDTIYIGADTLVYRQYRFCDIPEGTVKASKSRLDDILTDAVTEFRRKAAEAAAAEKEEQDKKLKEGLAKPAAGKDKQAPPADAPADKAPGKDKPRGKDKPAPEPPAEVPEAKQAPEAKKAPADTIAAAADTLKAVADSLVAATDSLFNAAADTLKASADSLKAAADSLTAPLDSAIARLGRLPSVKAPLDSISATEPVDSVALKAQADSLARADSLANIPPPDTTRYGFAKAIHNVKVFRRDIQVRCDSMVYNDLDSIARFHLDPVVWNDGNRQYTADSLFVLVGGGGVRKASLQSNAFVITQDAPDIFDQIKGAEIMAYFDSTTNTLQRFDAMGGSAALFYLKEQEVFATVNKVESKMLSALLKDGTLDQVYYFEAPKNNAYPIVQLPEAEKQMKGFQWRYDERPTGPQDITPLRLRISEREFFKQRKLPVFKYSKVYFPGYIDGINREIAEREALARMPRPKKELSQDTLLAEADSLAAAADSLVRDIAAAADSIQITDSLRTADGIKAPADSTAARADSLAVHAASQEEVDPLSVPTVDPKQKRLEEREARRKLRIAARDARIAERERRWARLDSLDAAKAAAKEQKKLEKERARKLRQLRNMQRLQAREEAKLQKYIEKYRKEYEREQQKSKSSGKRAPSVEAGRAIPAPPESGEKAPRGDPVLRDDGVVDDGPVFRGRSLPGT